MALPIDLRPCSDIDTPFIFSSWLRSYASSAYGGDNYYKRHHQVIEQLMARPGVRMLAATPKEDPQTIIGWSAQEDSVLHYVYVKEAFRRMGVATLLVGEYDTITHLTPYGLKWMQASKQETSVYDPYLAIMKPE